MKLVEQKYWLTDWKNVKGRITIIKFQNYIFLKAKSLIKK